MTEAIRYKLLGSDVYILQSDHRGVKKCDNPTAMRGKLINFFQL